MTLEELQEEIAIELEAMQQMVRELLALQRDLQDREPTIREKTAASAFLAQFYNAVENVLKRISRYHGIQLPDGEAWHVELFQRFSSPYPGLPQLLNENLAAALAPYRRFRHVVFHGYSFQLDWQRMVGGVMSVQSVYDEFRASTLRYLATLAD